MDNQDFEFSIEEMAYRRGYHQGFSIARRKPHISEQEVMEWRHSNDETAPPGSGLAGRYLPGLRKDETHRFFINQLEPKKESHDPDLGF